ncbi:MAG TPA: filamentous hemagglutinin, partial [Alcanivorax sp.]|nr:filamentous hemagglutinin [Alcanivorax sp.]
MAHRDGGSVTLASSRDVALEAGSLIDVSSGGAVTADGQLLGGRGGDITLSAATTVNDNSGTSENGVLTLDGDLRGYGVDGGGTLSIESGQAIVVGDELFETEGLLAAGQEAPVDLTLLEEVVIEAGGTLPFNYEYRRTQALPGQPFGDSPLAINGGPGVTLAADWVVPDGVMLLAGGSVYQGGATVPAGATITVTQGSPAPDYVVPADVFPQGLPVAESMAVAQAGTPLPVDAVFSPGQTLGAGIVLDRDVRVEAVSTLAPEYFQNGFSNYEVNGHRGVHVTEGASIDVAMPVYRYRPGMINAVDRDAALEVWTPPLYQALPEERRVVRRDGASLTLKSESQRRPGAIAISEGATVQVDPGQSITLSGGQTTVEGTLRAHGGRIDILNPETDGVTQSQSLGESIWIGENALLDASGFAYTATGARGRRYGEVLDGGQVTLGSLAPDEL